EFRRVLFRSTAATRRIWNINAGPRWAMSGIEIAIDRPSRVGRVVADGRVVPSGLGRPQQWRNLMKEMISFVFAGMLMTTGAVAGTEHDERRVDHQTSSETTSEKAGSQHDHRQKEERREHEKKNAHGDKEGLGTMGTGATGTTGGMGATTGTDTIE